MARGRSVRMMVSVTPELRGLLEAYGQRMGIPAATAAYLVLEQYSAAVRAIVELGSGGLPTEGLGGRA